MPSIQFKGKSIVQYHHLSVPYRRLLPVADKSVTGDKPPSLNDNLIIHGDNLSALKALLPSFAGKVKCIYIDPPYNTGNEGWKYNDNVNSPMHQEWLGQVVDKEDLTRHDKWLCMMWPRLTAERVRRVIQGVPNARDEQLRAGLGGAFSYMELGQAYDEASLLSGERLPRYEDLARYVFFTATGEQWDEAQMDKARWYLGQSARYHVYLYYTDDVDQLKNMPLNLSFVRDVLGVDWRRGDKPRLVIAALKYLDEDTMRHYGVEYCQLPFGIYKFKAGE